MEITAVRSNDTASVKVAESPAKKQDSADKVFENSKDYENYLNEKYDCLQTAKGGSVAIAPNLMSKAATDPKTREWLEHNLKMIPEAMSKIQQNAAQNGFRVESCHVSFDGYDRMTTMVHMVSEVETETAQMKKSTPLKLPENKEQKRQLDEWQEQVKGLHRKQRFMTTDVDRLLGKVGRTDFRYNSNADGTSIDFKI